MKNKLLILALVFTPLLAYLEWGKDNHTFLGSAEWDILQKLFTAPSGVMHPLVLLPLAGQIILLLSLFLHKQARWIVPAGIAMISILLFFILFIGLLSLKFKIILSTFPFLGAVTFYIYNRKVTRK